MNSSVVAHLLDDHAAGAVEPPSWTTRLAIFPYGKTFLTSSSSTSFGFGVPILITSFMFSYPPGTILAMLGMELNSIASRHALTHALVALCPCWSAPNPHSTHKTGVIVSDGGGGE